MWKVLSDSGDDSIFASGADVQQIIISPCRGWDGFRPTPPLPHLSLYIGLYTAWEGGWTG